ncbi:MAG: hypothetical protein M1541_16240 [Acidobacteria bacterium]|nr:hypothetical protein [Acidobacteriota bacterium]
MIRDQVSSEEKQEVLERVLRSRQFQRAPKLREFLRYVCEATSPSGGPPSLREQDIGWAVYQRETDYNPSEDNIVRVEARNLRRKLEGFFDEDEEGKQFPIIIRIPKGSYVPEFERRSFRESAPPEGQARTEELFGVTGSIQVGAPAKSEETAISTSTSVARTLSRTLRLAGMVVILLSAIVAGSLWLQNRSLKARLQSSPATLNSVPLWSALFDDKHNTYLVLADSGFVLIQDILKRHLTLADYLKGDFGIPSGRSNEKTEVDRAAAEVVVRGQFTSMTGARILAAIVSLPGVDRRRLIVRQAREMAPRDFRGNHLILVGSVRSNPWVELFEPKLNFRFEFNFSRSRPVVRNRSPRPGELPAYWAGGANGQSNEIYCTMALLPNLASDGNVLIISGTGGQGTESCSEMLLGPDLASKMIQQLRLYKDRRMRFFEVLVRSSQLGSTSSGVEILAHRILPE